MAKQSSIQKNLNRKKTVLKFKDKTENLKKKDYAKRFIDGRKI